MGALVNVLRLSPADVQAEIDRKHKFEKLKADEATMTATMKASGHDGAMCELIAGQSSNGKSGNPELRAFLSAAPYRFSSTKLQLLRVRPRLLDALQGSLAPTLELPSWWQLASRPGMALSVDRERGD